jgi:hypothetical protein
MQMYSEGTCAAKAKDGFSKDREIGSCIGAGGAFGSPNGAPSRRCPEQAHQHLGGAGRWGTPARPSGAPKQAAEAMPSSRGDTRRAAERARTGARGEEPLTRSTDLDPVNAERLRLRLGGRNTTSTQSL